MSSWKNQFIIIALVAGFAIGFLGHMAVAKFACENYTYINQSLACGEGHSISKAGYAVFENNLRKYIDAVQGAGRVSKVAVYFRDLEAGPTFGIREDDTFTPASLLKLAIILAYYNLAEEDPALLDELIIYKSEYFEKYGSVEQIEKPSVVLQNNTHYPAEELIYNVLVYSDNASYYALLEYINANIADGSGKVLRTFQELGIIDPENIADEVVTVRGYSSIFRTLYNISYLSPAFSEKVLSMLVQSTFNKGIAHGLPPNIALANKFGERELSDGSKQLHDCGIVYYPENPYILCIMTKGTDWDALAQIIEEISRRVYEEVDSRRL